MILRHFSFKVGIFLNINQQHTLLRSFFSQSFENLALRFFKIETGLVTGTIRAKHIFSMYLQPYWYLTKIDFLFEHYSLEGRFSVFKFLLDSATRLISNSIICQTKNPDVYCGVWKLLRYSRQKLCLLSKDLNRCIDGLNILDFSTAQYLIADRTRFFGSAPFILAFWFCSKLELYDNSFKYQ